MNGGKKKKKFHAFTAHTIRLSIGPELLHSITHQKLRRSFRSCGSNILMRNRRLSLPRNPSLAATPTQRKYACQNSEQSPPCFLEWLNAKGENTFFCLFCFLFFCCCITSLRGNTVVSQLCFIDMSKIALKVGTDLSWGTQVLITKTLHFFCTTSMIIKYVVQTKQVIHHYERYHLRLWLLESNQSMI